MQVQSVTRGPMVHLQDRWHKRTAWGEERAGTFFESLASGGAVPSLHKFQDFDVGVSRKVLAGSPKRNLILDRVLPAGLGQQNLELTLVTSLLRSGRFRNSKPGPPFPISRRRSMFSRVK
ncbi:hypothetical protein CEXT_395581 [Caerostris extrusa]|uniref:Uncharacterized protein n=1 Tax=Caerostris extrusa TaxID=172846 RepID=A0AAV4Y9S4_CAEEX|nr:hypothetical protein CEXT_395581 [Caerostris extrusa]